MQKGFLILLLFCFSLPMVEAQNRSFYPVKKTKKRNTKNKPESVLTEKEKLNFEMFFFNGLRQKALGNPEAAAEQFQKCIRIDGSKAAPMYEMAMLYQSFSQHEEALFFAEGANAIEKTNVWYKQLLAQLQVSNQKYSSAIQTYKQLLKEQKGNEEWHFQLASVYLLNDQLHKAIEVYDEMEEYVGVDEVLILQKQRIYMQLGDKKSATNELQKWMESEPQNPQPYGILAEQFLLEGDQQKAIEMLEGILKIDPDNGKAFLTLSDLYRNNGKAEKSLEALKKAFVSNQLGIDAKMRVLITYYDVSALDSSLKQQAFDLVDVLIQAHPEDAKPYTIAGDYYYREGELTLAKSAFLKALEFDQSRFPIWQQLLIICFDLKEYDSVLQHGSKAMELYPSETIPYLLSGMASIQLKQFNDAITMLNTGKLMVIENDELLAQFYSNLGDAYHSAKNNTMSDESYEESLALSPHNTYVLNNYSYYLSLRKEKLEKALEMMEVCTALNPGIASYEDTYAWVFYQAEYYEKALEWLERALQNGGDSSPVIVEHYGDVLFQLGRLEEALPAWKKAKELGSETEFIDQKIANKKLYE